MDVVVEMKSTTYNLLKSAIFLRISNFLMIFEMKWFLLSPQEIDCQIWKTVLLNSTMDLLGKKLLKKSASKWIIIIYML